MILGRGFGNIAPGILKQMTIWAMEGIFTSADRKVGYLERMKKSGFLRFLLPATGIGWRLYHRSSPDLILSRLRIKYWIIWTGRRPGSTGGISISPWEGMLPSGPGRKWVIGCWKKPADKRQFRVYGFGFRVGRRRL